MRTILFDLDGVIIDSMPAHAQAWQLAFEQVLRIQISKNIIYMVEGKPNGDVFKDVMCEAGLNHLIEEDLFFQINETKNKIFESIFTLKAVPDAIALIKCVYKMGYRLGVATGSNQGFAEEMLTGLGIYPFFSSIVSGEDVAHGKPDPESYLKLVEKLHGTKEQSLVIENAPLGVQAARAAGLICLAVASNNSPAKLSDASMVFENLNEIQRFFENEYQFTSGKGNWQVDGKLKI